MSKPLRVWAQRFANAKGDHEEAPRFTSARRMRRDSKKALARARRRFSKALCGEHA